MNITVKPVMVLTVFFNQMFTFYGPNQIFIFFFLVKIILFGRTLTIENKLRNLWICFFDEKNFFFQSSTLIIIIVVAA